MKYSVLDNGDIVIESLQTEVETIKKFVDMINPGDIEETLVKEIILRNLTFTISSILFTKNLDFDPEFPTINVIIPYKEINSVYNLWDHDLRITLAEIKYKNKDNETIVKKMYGRQD